ncbi:MAG: T9SS type A sorting domain-containing protein [Ignavibacteria bacterium]|nr:T9SS type A sorting domain-containing protein [Ignavibacteria bacterium]
MKKIYYLFFICIIFVSKGYSQSGWQILNSGTTAYLSTVYFNDSLTGYAGGNNGYLAKTTNGGLNWTVQTSGISGFVREVQFADYNTGYFCGDNGALRKTTNDGLNWTNLTTGVSVTIYSLSVLSQNLLYACTNSGTVIKSTDGGNSFTTYNVSANSLLAIDFSSPDTGYVSGQGGVAYKTNNGGLNWTALNLSTVNNSWGIHALTNNFVFISANYGTIRKSTNGGTTITSSYAEGANLNSIFFATKMIGYAGGSGGSLIKTVNGGLTWELMNTGTTQSIEDIHFVNAKTGYAAGGSGLIMKTTDGGDNFNLKVISPKGREIWAGNSYKKIIWSNAVSGNIKVEYSLNNGSSWQLISNSYPADSNEYNWLVPSTLSNDCRIKITSLLNPSLSAVSDNKFRINWDIYAWLYSPEILYYKFNDGVNSTPNYAVSGYGIGNASITGHTLQNGGMYDSTLVGGGGTGSDHYVNTKWAASLPQSGWTIGFWVSNISLGTTPTNAVYLFGDVSANNFRCYYGGSGGIGSTDTAIMLRCTGMSDVRIPVVKGLSYYIHIVYDPALSNIKVYKNGYLSLAVPQSVFTVLGNGPFLIGAHSTFASSLSQNMKLDEFRIYDRALGASEIAVTWNWTLPYFMTSIKPIGTEIPGTFSLEQNYPNPFNQSSIINFQCSITGNVNIKVFDITGREVATLVNEILKPGTYQISFNAGNLPSGIYFYRMQAEYFTDVRKMILKK